MKGSLIAVIPLRLLFFVALDAFVLDVPGALIEQQAFDTYEVTTMALSAHGYWGSLDQTSNTNVYDYSPYFYRTPQLGGEVKLWPLLRKREDLTDTTCRWYEDSRLPMTVTGAASGTGSSLTAAVADVDLELAAGQVAAGFLRVGAVIRDTAAGKRELMQVTAISTDTLTVTRAYGLASLDANTETHAVSATYRIVGTFQSEGSTMPAGEATNLTERTNVTGIIDMPVMITRTQARRRLQAGVGDPLAYEVGKALDKIERQMEEIVLWSKNVTRASTPTTGSPAGIRDLIVDRAGSNYVTAADNFDYEVFDEAMGVLWSNGYEDDTPFVLVVPKVGKQHAATIHESALRGSYESSTTRGLKATHLVSKFGHEVPIIASTQIQTDEMLILNLDLITVRFVDTLLAYDLPLGEAGADKVGRRFISELSLEMHNADTAHYYQTGLTYSATGN